jgi:CBS domain containing-hemolysin-like protein
MQTLPASITRSELADFLESRPHTRIPVYRDSIDGIIGVVNSKDLEHMHSRELARELEQWKAVDAHKKNGNSIAEFYPRPDEQTLDLTSLMYEAVFVPETIRIDGLLGEFKNHRQQMAVVIDEYGGTVGLVTLADLLEQVFGDLPDEAVEKEPEILERPDGSLQLTGGVSIDEVNELFGFGFPTDQAVTMAGLVVNLLGRIAAVGDEVEIYGCRLRVEQVDRFRITSLGLFPPSDKMNEEQSLDQGR